MTTYYKAVRPDYTDFWIGTVRYEVGTTLTHPNPHRDDASGYFSVSVEPAACAGMDWPCRLLVIEPVDPWTPDPSLPHKRAFHVGRVVREVSAEKTCQTCGYVHPSNAAAAVGRFGGTKRWIALDMPGATHRASRAEAEDDWCRGRGAHTTTERGDA